MKSFIEFTEHKRLIKEPNWIQSTTHSLMRQVQNDRESIESDDSADEADKILARQNENISKLAAMLIGLQTRNQTILKLSRR